MVTHENLDLAFQVRVLAGQHFDSAFGLAQCKFWNSEEAEAKLS